jgi:hypothetical protein
MFIILKIGIVTAYAVKLKIISSCTRLLLEGLLVYLTARAGLTLLLLLLLHVVGMGVVVVAVVENLQYCELSAGVRDVCGLF